MAKYSQVSDDFRGRAVLRLYVALAAFCLIAVMPVAIAAPRPLRYSEAREVAPHHVRARRKLVQAAPESSARKSSKPGSKSGKTKANVTHPKAPAAKSAARARHRKLRPEDEADNDPLVVHRVSSRRRGVRRDASRRSIASRRADIGVEQLGSERASAETPVAKKSVTSEDFVRAAARGTDADGVFERGQSHPDDDERLPVTKSQSIVADVSAAPEPVTPVGKATLPEKLRSATASAETAMKSDAEAAKDTVSGRGRARTSVLPEDHAARAAVVEQAMTPMVLPTLYTRHGRLIVPPPMKGTRDILIHQNVMADSEGLDRIQNDEDLDRLRNLGLLMPLDDSAALRVNDELPENRRYARPWAVRFAADTSRAFYSRFHQPLHLNSAVRTVEYQLRLQMVNGNAAAVDGDGASPHLTGQALDFGKRGMSRLQIAWMRAYLAPLMRAGKVDVEEEFQQACFHISVYRNYTPMMLPKTKAPAKMEVARAELSESTATER